jgi:hypothetical protein
LLKIDLHVAYDSRHFEYRSRFENGANAARAVLATHTRVFEPAERRLLIVQHAVDRHAAGLDLRSDASGALNVGAA